MPSSISPPDYPSLVPDPDQIRAAIDAADEQARLLRRLLRLALRLRLNVTTPEPLTGPPGAKGAGRG